MHSFRSFTVNLKQITAYFESKASVCTWCVLVNDDTFKGDPVNQNLARPSSQKEQSDFFGSCIYIVLLHT